MPLVTETEKNHEFGRIQEYAIKSINIESPSKAIITAINSTKLADIQKVLCWFNNRSKIDGKKELSITTQQQFIGNSSCIVDGDIRIALDIFKMNFISENTHTAAIKILDKLDQTRTNQQNVNASVNEEKEQIIHNTASMNKKY